VSHSNNNNEGLITRLTNKITLKNILGLILVLFLFTLIIVLIVSMVEDNFIKNRSPLRMSLNNDVPEIVAPD